MSSNFVGERGELKGEDREKNLRKERKMKETELAKYRQGQKKK